jgi:hypothetical protein
VLHNALLVKYRATGIRRILITDLTAIVDNKDPVAGLQDIRWVNSTVRVCMLRRV